MKTLSFPRTNKLCFDFGYECHILSNVLTRVEIQFRHLQGISFAFLLREGKHDNWRKLPLHYHLDNLEAIRSLPHASLFAHSVALRGFSRGSVLQDIHRLQQWVTGLDGMVASNVHK